MDICAFLVDLRERLKKWGEPHNANVQLAEETVHAIELLEGGGLGVNVVVWWEGDDPAGEDLPESTIHNGKLWVGVTRHAGLAKQHFQNHIEGDEKRPALLGIVQSLRKFLFAQTFADGLPECETGAYLHSAGMKPLAFAPGQFLRGYSLRMGINYTALVGDEEDVPPECAEEIKELED